MNLSVGPSFRTYTIIQAVLLFGLSGALTFRVSPTRAAIVTALIAVIAFALSALTWSRLAPPWSRKNKIPSTAAYVLGITAEISLMVPGANHPVVRATVESLTPSVSLGLADRIMLVATILIFVGSLTVGLGAFIHSMVKELPQGWRTPLWGRAGNALLASVTPLRDRQHRGAKTY